tara:strand:- start:2545 stop:2907 length:363 start_codon:yes stop_codon:yes gene_type:complete
MLTIFEEIFIWWNRQTLGTRIYTLIFGKCVGQDEFGNKYYQNKKNSRWVIYKDEIDASKIPVEWYSWIHFTNNKIEKIHKFEKYKWQKSHKYNQTGTNKAYNPLKKKNESTKKKYTIWKN